MRGTHARSGPEVIRDSLWRPLSVLALVGLTPPAVIIAGRADAHGAPAPARTEQQDAPIEQAAADAACDVVDCAEPHPHPHRWGGAGAH